MEQTTLTTPVGTWLERFSVQGEPKSSVLHFTPTGRAFILAGPEHGGVGSGTWAMTGENSFSYRIAERIIDLETGKYAGWVDIDHHAVLGDEGFSSSGFSRVYDTRDELIVGVPIEARASRLHGTEAAERFRL